MRGSYFLVVLKVPADRYQGFTEVLLGVLMCRIYLQGSLKILYSLLQPVVVSIQCA